MEQKQNPVWMPEFIYRAKNKTTKEWVQGHYVPHFCENSIDIGPCIITKTENDSQVVSIDESTLGISFGKHDKNGKLIFTGDFVVDKECQIYGTVVFDLSGFCVEDIDDGIQSMDSFADINAWENVEIVGNLYDSNGNIEKIISNFSEAIY